MHLILGGRHLIEGNVVSDNGLSGIAGWHTNGTVLRHNTVERNNRLGFDKGKNANTEEYAGIKVHAFADGVIEANLVRGNHGWGVWLDNGYENARVTDNLVLDNARSGIFIELGDGYEGKATAQEMAARPSRGFASSPATWWSATASTASTRTTPRTC